MAVRRKTYAFRKNAIVEVEEFHDGNYGKPGVRRKQRNSPTREDKLRANAREKAKRCRHRLLEYFTPGDVIATWTYRQDERPEDMAAALKDFQKAIRKVKAEYKRNGRELFWIRNLEKGTKGAWHIHVVINETGDVAAILQRAWDKGGVYVETLKQNKLYDPTFRLMAEYMCKDENTKEKKQDGTEVKPRVKESSYSHSRNMPLPDPEKKYLKRWKEEVKPQKGYYIADYYEGINPKTGYKYRRYTLISLERRREDDGDRHLHRAKRKRSTRKKP